MQYFAYGSNMLTERIRGRVPSAEPVTRAHLPGYGIAFHKRSQDGSGKATLLHDPPEASSVHGVIFELSRTHLPALDEAEHRGRGYKRCRVHPQTPTGSIEAFAYVAQPAYVDEALAPYAWYHATVVAGAYQHELPSDYRAQLEAVRTYPDPNERRREQYRSLLRRAGYVDLWPEK